MALSMILSSSTVLASETRITVYSGDFDSVSASVPSANMPGLAQVSQTINNDSAHDSKLSTDRLPLAIDVGSVQLIPNNPRVRVSSQRYDFALLTQDQLLQQAIGQRVVVEQVAGNDTRRFSGVLLSAGDGLALQQDDGRLHVLARYDSFELERAPEGISARPALRWILDGTRSNKEDFRLDYATGGLGWQAEYLISLDGAAQHGHMAMSGAAQVVNRSGLDYPATNLTLVAGSPNRARATAPGNVMMMAMPAPAPKSRMAEASYDAGIQAQDSGEYHAYPLPKPVDLPNGSLQRVSLLDSVQGIEFQRRYEVGQTTSGYRPSYPQLQWGEQAQSIPVGVSLVFANDKAAGLGQPLPAGRVRVFQAGANGDELLGESRIAHSASGQKIELALGTVFDLSAKRQSTAFKLADDRLSLSETIEVTLSNAKAQAVTINLHENLSRWQDWEISNASQAWKPVNAQSIDFDVKVPAQGETVVRYTVTYRWPINVRP